MTRAAFMLLHAIIALAFGILFVLSPAAVLALYGVRTDATGTFMARLFGAALVQVGLVALFARKDIDSPCRRAVQVGCTVGLALGSVVALAGQVSGLFNALGWSTVAIYLTLAVGYGYYQLRPSAP